MWKHCAGSNSRSNHERENPHEKHEIVSHGGGSDTVHHWTTEAGATTYDQFIADQKIAKRAEKSEAGQRRLDWWRDARFGMFIHWGPSSLAGSEISLSKQFYDDTGEHKLDNPRPSATPDHPEHRVWFDWFGPPVPRVVYDNLHKSFYPGHV